MRNPVGPAVRTILPTRNSETRFDPQAPRSSQRGRGEQSRGLRKTRWNAARGGFLATILFLGTATGATAGTPGAIRLARSRDGLRFADAGVEILPLGDRPDLEIGPDGDLHALARIESRSPSDPNAVWITTTSEDEGKTWRAAKGILVQTDRGSPVELPFADLIRVPGGPLRLVTIAAVEPRSTRKPTAPNSSREATRGVFLASCQDEGHFRLRRRSAWEIDSAGDRRVLAAAFSGRIHLYVDGPESATRRRSGERTIEHRVSRDGRRFVSVQPSRIPNDVVIGSIIEAGGGGARMYVSVGDAVRSFFSRDGRVWREERGVRLSGGRSPAVVRLRDDTYLMAYVAGRFDRATRTSDESRAGAPDPTPAVAPTPAPPVVDDAALAVTTDESIDEGEDDGEPQTTEDPEVGPPDSPLRDVISARRPLPPSAAQTNEIPKELQAAMLAQATQRDSLDEEDGGEVGDGFAPRPDEKPDIDYNEWLRSQIPADVGDNAASAYEEIANDPRMKASENPDEAPAFNDMFNSDYDGPPIPWDASDHPEWAESGTRVRDLLQKFDRAASRANYAPPLRFDEESLKTRQPLLIDIMLPDLSAHRRLVKATLADAWRKEDGRASPQRMLNAWRTVLRGANHFRSRPTLIENLVSIAERNAVFKTAAWALKQEVLTTEAEFQEALDVLRSLGRDQYDPGMAAKGEFAMAVQLTQYLFSPLDADGRPRLNPQHIDEMSPLFEDWFDADGPDTGEHVSAMTVEDYYATLDAFDRFYREVADQLRVGYPDVRAQDMEATQERYVRTTALTELLMPVLSRVLVLRTRSEATYRATQLIYAMHLFRARQGRWPRSLDELPGDVPAEIRTDPFTGRDFGYRLSAGGPIVYSLSENGEDDGGVHSPRWGDGAGDENASDDFVFWPVQP